MNSSIRPFVLGSVIYLITYFIPLLPIIHYFEGENQGSTKIEISITGFDLLTKSASIKGEPTEDKDFKKHEYIERMYELKKEKKEDGMENNNSTDKLITYPQYGWFDKLPTIGAILSVLLIFFYYGKYYSLIYWTKIFVLSVFVLCFLRYGFVNILNTRSFTVFPAGIITLIISFIMIAFDKYHPAEDSI